MINHNDKTTNIQPIIKHSHHTERIGTERVIRVPYIIKINAKFKPCAFPHGTHCIRSSQSTHRISTRTDGAVIKRHSPSNGMTRKVLV
ncbi:MAG: hypothetical protein ACC608_06210 [Anaerofustis sp.]